MEKKDNRSLMKRLSASDISALEEIYVVFAPKVRSFVTHYIGKEEAEDLTQDIFLKIWQSRNKISSILIRDLDSYIFRISKNYVLDRLKHKKIEKRYISESVAETAGSEPQSRSTEEKIDNRSEILRVNKRMQQLSDLQRKIFYMQRAEGKTYSEISRELGISEKTVQYHISSILNKLRSPS